MKKGLQKVTFKPYTMEQPMLLPQSLDELIPAGHLVRVVNRVIEGIDLEPLLAKYAGGGTSAFHPAMLLKVLVYASHSGSTHPGGLRKHCGRTSISCG